MSTLSTIKFVARKRRFVLFVCFVPSLSSCQEKATVALYFGRIRTRLGVSISEFFLYKYVWLKFAGSHLEKFADSHLETNFIVSNFQS